MNYNFVPYDGLVEGYIGRTAIKTKEIIDKVKGGILCMDDTYLLSLLKTNNDFGPETSDALLKATENYSDDLIVIINGYHDLMQPK